MLVDLYPVRIVDLKGRVIGHFIYDKGKEYDVTEDTARDLLKLRMRITDKIEYHSYAELVEDLGLHYGRSKHIYVKDGLSKVNIKGGIHC